MSDFTSSQSHHYDGSWKASGFVAANAPTPFKAMPLAYPMPTDWTPVQVAVATATLADAVNETTSARDFNAWAAAPHEGFYH